MQQADLRSRRAGGESEPRLAPGRAPGKEQGRGLEGAVGSAQVGAGATGEDGASGERSAAGEVARAGDWEPTDALLAALGLAEAGFAGAGPEGAAELAGVPVQALGGALDATATGEGAEAGEGGAGAPAREVSEVAASGVAEASAPLPHFEVIQRAFGRHDLRRLRAQVGGGAAQAAKKLGASAYATGERIAFAEAPDLRTAAHEAAHVVQQASGRVQLPGGLGRVGDPFEQHAEAVAEAVVAGRSAEPLLDAFTGGAEGAGSAEGAQVQRAPDYRSSKDLAKLTLRDFDRYAHAQADWAVSDELHGTRDALRALLAFARADKGLVLGACAAFKVGTLLQRQLGQGTLVDAQVIAYSKAASPGRRKGTVHVEARATNFGDLLDWGAALLALEHGLGGLLIESVVPQFEGMECLAELVDAKAIDDFIQYVQVAKPMLHASNGKEIYCFLEFRKQGGLTKVGTYKSQLPEIRSLHRFTVEQLELLCKHRVLAMQNRSSHDPKPICVVLQTGVDATAVFGHNAALTELLRRGSHLVLLAEGRPTINAFAGDLASFAALGKDGKIDELVISAHGSATTQKLAGTVGEHVPKDEVEPAYGVISSGSLDSGAKHPTARGRTKQFFQLVAKLLRNHPDSRLVLNGCLTASNHPRGATLDPDPDRAAKQLLHSIAEQPNLATFVRQILGGHRAQVRGANASFAAAKSTLVGPDGRAELVLTEDPALTVPDKLGYLEHGNEPSGVMRALLECWAQNRGTALAALKRRQAARETDLSWRECILRGAFKLALAHYEDATTLQVLSEAVGALWHLKHRQNASVSKLLGKVKPELLLLLEEDVRKSELWTSTEAEHLPPVFLQAILPARPTVCDELLTCLDASSFTPQNAEQFFDLKVLAPYLDILLLPPSQPQTFRRASLLLALLHLSERGASAPAQAKQYVAAVVGQAQQFPPGCGGLLKGLNERRLLKHAGVLGEEGPQAARPNVVTSYGGDNTVAVRSVTRRCRVPGHLDELPLYTLPSGEGAGEVMPGGELHVIGELTVTCPDEVEMGGLAERTLFTGRAPGERLALLAVEWVGPFPTAFVERSLVE